jgi:hypothetical protein
VLGRSYVRRAPRNRSTRSRRLARLAVSAAHWVLACAVLFGVVHSGNRYFYCEALGLMPSDPCIEASPDAQGKSPLAMLGERRADCCEIVTLAAMPRAAQAAGLRVAPAACVAVVPALGFVDPSDSASPVRVERAFERWRPPPRASNDVRAQLMVFLI